MSADADERIEVEAAVVGGGPAGLTAAIGLASAGVETALIGPRGNSVDYRTTALLAGSVAALRTLGVWEYCEQHAAPLRVLRIIDDAPRLLRAPEVTFHASEIELDAFGSNIENRHLVAALDRCIDGTPALVRVDRPAEAVNPGASQAIIHLAGGGAVAARLVIGADGRRSLCRSAAGIETSTRSYPQTALTFNLAHTRPHDDVSTEFHTPEGPFTLVPLTGSRSSLVCVVGNETAESLAPLGDDAVAAALERRAHSILGKFAVEPGRGIFPLAMERAQVLGANRIALAGEAAHVIPPIGAQGLNLGLRDVATISELAIAGRRAGADIGAPELLRTYDRLRRADVASRTLAVDLLNRSLLSGFLPIHGLRGFGLYLLDRLGPLRRAVMREGIAPRLGEPRLMRGEALGVH